MKYSLSAQIEEVGREIALREKVYPHQVRSAKMRQAVADMHLDRMRSVLRTLEWLRAHEADIKAKLGEAA